MAIKFQYNKTSLQVLRKQLSIRARALPTLKNKESALRVEVKRARDKMTDLHQLLKAKMDKYDSMAEIWGEFDKDLIFIDDVKLSSKKLAGVRIPILDEIIFKTKPFSIFNSPKWYLDGVSILKELGEMAIQVEFFQRKSEILDHARKKTTQKVNLYEKVQIPGYEDAILKIKRFMEDEENLSKSSQKIVKQRQQKAKEALA